MYTLLKLIKRNSLLYLRNKTTVFFSMLSMIIIILLYALFLGDVQIDSLAYEFGDRASATNLINSWIMGGIIMVNAVNVTLVVLVNMVEDYDKGKIKDLLVSPLKKWQIIGGYLGAAIVLGIAFSIISLIMAEGYIVLNGGALLNFKQLIKVLIGIIATVIAIAPFFLFVLLFIKSEKTAATLTTITGTLVGFVAGVYIPIGLMPEVVQKVMKVMPITYSATLFKEIFVFGPSKNLFPTSEALLEFNKTMGNVIYYGDYKVSYFNYLIFLILSGILFFLFSMLKIRKDNK